MCKKVIFLLFLSTLLSSCTYRWYREFLPDESLSKQETYGWVFKPVLYAYKNIAGDSKPNTPNEFSFTLWADNIAKHNIELYDIFIDTMSITIYPIVNSNTRDLIISSYVSFSSDKEIVKTFHILASNESDIPNSDKYNFEIYNIEEHVDSLKISFNAKFVKAILAERYIKKYTMKFDSLNVPDTTDYEIVPIEFMMYRHESKTKIPAFFKSM